jgi:filamentous hemagglutinin
MRSNPNNDQKKLLIAELKKAAIKHTPENILRITKDPSGKIVFLETGKGGERGSGLLHILENHREDFLQRGITEEQIPDLIITAISEGKIIGIQGKSRIIYQVEINGIIQYVSLEISHNGYLVSANPTPTRLINKLIQE